MMKRIVVIFIILIMTLFFGGICAGKRLNQTELEHFMVEANAYVQGLDTEKDPVLVKWHNDTYNLKIEDGKPTTLLGSGVSTSMPLDNSENWRIAKQIHTDATEILRIIQVCFHEGYYTEPFNDPYSEIPYAIYLDLNEKGIELFSEMKEVISVSVEISTEVSNNKTEKAIQVGGVFLTPNGLDVFIQMKNETYSVYSYGAAYDYVLTTFTEEIRKND